MPLGDLFNTIEISDGRASSSGARSDFDIVGIEGAIAMVEEEFSGLLDLLPDEELRQVALWKLEGYTNAEIASEIGRHERSVERKLQIIRGIWETNEESEKHI